jgi:very-short-patch-repair endonuclease
MIWIIDSRQNCETIAAAGRKTGGCLSIMQTTTPTTLTLAGYLTETTLADALVRIVGVDRWLGGQLRVQKCRKRWDMGFRSDDAVIVVEYDGDGHYCNTLKIRADRDKDQIAAAQGWRTVRFPYWN